MCSASQIPVTGIPVRRVRSIPTPRSIPKSLAPSAPKSDFFRRLRRRNQQFQLPKPLLQSQMDAWLFRLVIRFFVKLIWYVKLILPVAGSFAGRLDLTFYCVRPYSNKKLANQICFKLQRLRMISICKGAKRSSSSLPSCRSVMLRSARVMATTCCICWSVYERYP